MEYVSIPQPFAFRGCPTYTQRRRTRTIPLYKTHSEAPAKEVVVPGNSFGNGVSFQVVKPVKEPTVPPSPGEKGLSGDWGMIGKKVVIVGGGPAGSCTALYMAKLGAKVEVYEARVDEQQVAGASPRSYIIILQKRGLQAMEDAGAGVSVDDDTRFLGSVNISKDGKTRTTPGGGMSVGFARADLAAHLMKAAIAQHETSVSFHLGWRCIGGDLAGRSITFKHAESNETRTVKYDLLVGADGQNSRVRDIFEDQIDGFRVDVRATDREYKRYWGLTSDALEYPGAKEGRLGRSLYMWASKRPGFLLTANRRRDGVFSGNFTAVTGKFESLSSEADYLDVLQNAFAGLPDGWASEIAKQVAERESSKFPKTVKCSQLHGPSAVLIGDAAHAVTPILGQGANAALEDCGILARAIESKHGDIDAATQEFNRLRRNDVHSLVDINRFVEKATRIGPFSVFLLAPVLVHVVFGTIRHKLLPFLFKQPAIMRLDETVSYRDVVVGIVRDCAFFVSAVVLFAVYQARSVGPVM